MANTIGWGKGTQNNSNGWGKFQNTIGAASIYEDSYAGETVLIGTSAAFSYSASSFHQGEADPTPTITGTTGGTFSATPSGLSINTSTGTIDLDNSTIQSYTITYTVSGVSANQTLAVTASPFVANNHSFLFDGVNDAILFEEVTYSGAFTMSFWVNPVDFSTNNRAFLISDNTNQNFIWLLANNDIRLKINGTQYIFTESGGNNIVPSTWQNITITRDASNNINCFRNASSFGSSSTLSGGFDVNRLAQAFGGNWNYNGKMDEVAIWNAALSSDAVQEIYNATANNTGKVLDLNTDSGNYTSSANLQYWNRLGD